MGLNINQEVIDLIEQKYQIIKIIDFFYYDLDPEAMADVMAPYYNLEFEHNQRLVVLHHETDYYAGPGIAGNTIYNFLRLCANYMIPLDKIILLTNHYGIENEIKSTAKQICNDDSINVIYTSQWYDFPSTIDIDHKSDDTNITNLYSCLNGQQRQHRVMTLCMLKEYELFDNGIISYNFGN